MGKKDATPRNAQPPASESITKSGPHLSMNPSWRAVQGGDEESIQTRKSLTIESPSQRMEGRASVVIPPGANMPSGVNRPSEAGPAFNENRPFGVNRPPGVNGPSGVNRAPGVNNPANATGMTRPAEALNVNMSTQATGVNRPIAATNVNRSSYDNGPPAVYAPSDVSKSANAIEETESRKGETDGGNKSLWFPHLRKEGFSKAQKGFSLVRNLIHPEGVQLRNQGVQVGESFIPLAKRQSTNPLETAVQSAEEDGDILEESVKLGDTAGSASERGQESEKTPVPSCEAARLGRRMSANLNGATPLDRIGSNTPSGFVRRLEIQIQDDGEIKAEEIWRDAVTVLGDPPNECRRQLSKIPSDILPKPEGRICVLAIDGGGVRGLIPALMLARLEGMLQVKSGNPDARIADYFDLIAGTSVGGLLAVMLLTPNECGRPLFSAAEAATFIRNNCPMIFYKHWLAGLRQIFKPKYSTKPLERILDYYLTDPWETPLTLKHLLKPCLITSYDLSRAAPRFFVRQRAQSSDSHDFKLRDVCRATAAAPTYFKPADITSIDGSSKAVCADGGIIANNPTLAALNHVIVNREEFPRTSLMGRRLILSLGAGEGVDTYEYKQARNWGSLGWAMPVMNMMLWGNGNTVDFIMTLFAEALSAAKSYLRIEVKHLTGTTKELDNSTPANIAALEQLTEEALARKAVTLDGSGFAHELDQTYGERLEEFADELIAEADARPRRTEPTVRIAAAAPARLREDLRGKKVDRGGTFLSWRKQGLPVGAGPTNPEDTN